MNKTEAEEHALHICRTLGVDDETALLGGLPAYLQGIVAALKAENARLRKGVRLVSDSTAVLNHLPKEHVDLLAAFSSPPAPDKRHPEDRCHKCGGRNIIWFAPDEIWNLVCPEGGILCPLCFVEAAEQVGIHSSWRIAPRETPASDPRRAAYKYAVYSGSERIDLGPKGEPAVLCRSEAQARHMSKFWGAHGYVEIIPPTAESPKRIKRTCAQCDEDVTGQISHKCKPQPIPPEPDDKRREAMEAVCEAAIPWYEDLLDALPEDRPDRAMYPNVAALYDAVENLAALDKEARDAE